MPCACWVTSNRKTRIKPLIWIWIALAVALVEWYAVWHGYVMLNRITKPVVIACLIAWFTLLGGWQHNLLWFGLGLAFSLAGDIFLLISSNRAFMAGLAAFMTAHIFYILGFNQTPFPFHWPVYLLLALLLVVGLSIGKVILAGLRKKRYRRRMIAPVMVYIAVICLMAFSALLTLFKPEWPSNAAIIAAAGAALFTLSDSILGYDRFVRQVSRGRFWVMFTYHLAQVSLITSALVQSGAL